MSPIVITIDVAGTDTGIQVTYRYFRRTTMQKHAILKMGAATILAASMFVGMPAITRTMAQDATQEAAPEMPPLPGELVVGDLYTPRGIAFDANGNLIVVVAGNGGELSVTGKSPEGEATFKIGMSGQVLSIGADGKSTPIIQGFPSYATEQEITGLYRAIPHGDSLWLVVSASGPGQYWGDSVVELDAASYMVKRVIALYPYEVANNPDGNEIDSNVTDLAWGKDGTLYITDAGANTLWSWTEEKGITAVTSWKENSVPTSVEVAENGDLYVGFLGEGLAPGAGKIEHWSDGKLVETFANMTTVIDILLDGDKLYAVELAQITEQGPGPGRVVTVDANGVTPVAEGLITPFGIAKGPDGALYVSYGTLAFTPGMTGGVVKLNQ
ncbi:MAG: ScyD/ScyE family protein [Anaerolineaceae bacterium]|nr:ScyD/ScyE family protein [Anaerolineaceae bacterium]